MSQTSLPELLTAKQVAELFQVHPTTIERWERDGTLTAIRVGRTVRFRREDVQQVIKGSAS